MILVQLELILVLEIILVVLVLLFVTTVRIQQTVILVQKGILWRIITAWKLVREECRLIEYVIRVGWIVWTVVLLPVTSVNNLITCMKVIVNLHVLQPPFHPPSNANLATTSILTAKPVPPTNVFPVKEGFLSTNNALHVPTANILTSTDVSIAQSNVLSATIPNTALLVLNLIISFKTNASPHVLCTQSSVADPVSLAQTIAPNATK